MLAAQEYALHVDRQDLLPLLDRLGLEGRGEWPGDAGIVGQTVQPALAFEDAVDDALPAGFLRRVVELETCLAANLLNGLEPARAIDVAHDHRGALGRQQLRGCTANARSRAGHQHDLVRNAAHALHPLTFLRAG
jgi:hypothetical protein